LAILSVPEENPMGGKKGELNLRQRRFVIEYIADLNATQAAIRAGYSPKTAYSMGHDLLKNPEIERAITEAQANREKRTGITADRVVLELARVALSDVRRLYRDDGTLKPPSEWDDDTAAAIAGLESKEEFDSDGCPSGTLKSVKRWDKIRALELLGKHLNLFKEEKQNVNVSVSLGLADIQREASRREVDDTG
jgi:phage terminase small subunit